MWIIIPYDYFSPRKTYDLFFLSLILSRKITTGVFPAFSIAIKKSDISAG